MASPASTSSFRSSSSFAAVAALAAVLTALPPAPARACGGGEGDIREETTFDPAVLGDAQLAGLFYNPYTEGWGEPCSGDCARQELLADWAPYLAGVDPKDWAKALFDADLQTIDSLIFHLQGKQPKPPAGWEKSSLTALPPDGRARAVKALFLAGFARRVEPLSGEQDLDWSDDSAVAWQRRSKRSGEAEKLQRSGEKAFAAATDPFLRQRYGFLLLRLRFYRQDWAGVAAFHKANTAALEGPSDSLKWRASHYLAGASWRMKKYADANLELARVAANAPRLAGSAVRDFHPHGGGRLAGHARQGDHPAGEGLALGAGGDHAGRRRGHRRDREAGSGLALAPAPRPARGESARGRAEGPGRTRKALPGPRLTEGR
ncbi:MAG: hypothetical protein QM767_13060 [Anaeromyxobacter sp.]